MKNVLCDPLFCGVISLQIAAAALVFAPIGADSIPLSSIPNSWNRASLEVGHPFPEFVTYNSQGARQPLDIYGKENTVIFRSTCSCEDTAISNWANSAVGQRFAVLVPLSGKEAAQTVGHTPWRNRVLQVRLGTLEKLGLLKDNFKRLPLAVRIDKDGVILGVQTL